MEGGGSMDVEKFAKELKWCITQIELGLQNQSPDSRQAVQAVKILRILKSSKAPIVKKRQTMHNALGDYRKKMREAEKKSLSGVRQSRFQPPGSLKGHSKSRFLRCSLSKQMGCVNDELHGHMNNLHLQQYAATGTGATPLTSSSSAGMIVQGNSAVSVEQPAPINAVHTSSQHQITVNSDLIAKSASELRSQTFITTVPSSSSSPPPPPRQNRQSHKHYSANNFKFVSSDNSFCFGFEDLSNAEDDTDKVDVGAKREDIPHNYQEKESAQSPGTSGCSNTKCKSGPTAKFIYYKFERSNNDFRFNFEESGDNSADRK